MSPARVTAGIALGVCAAGGLKASYFYGTAFEKDVVVKRRFTRSIEGKSRTTFMVSCQDNSQLKIDPDLWGRDNLNEGRPYRVKGYGWSIGFLNLIPSVHSVVPLEECHPSVRDLVSNDLEDLEKYLP
jgi:hypothetical protein